MPRLVRLAVLALLALAASTTSARAGALGLIIAGEPAKQPVIETTLEPWLKAKGFQVQLRVSDPKVADKLVDCFIITDQRCGEAAVAKLGLPTTLFVMVEVHHDTKANSDEVKLTGWLYGEKGLSITSQSVFCRDCKNDTLAPTVEDLAQSLFRVAGEGTGRVRITSTPPGAAVKIDGSPVGATPWEQGLRTGEHTVILELPGHEPFTASVEIKKDETAAVEGSLRSLGAPPPGASRPKWPLFIAGAGAAVAIAGGVMIAIDQDCDDNLVTNPGGQCDVSPQTPTYRDSAPIGYALVGAGAVAIGAGVYLYLRSKPAATTAPTAWIDPGRGAGIGVVGRF